MEATVAETSPKTLKLPEITQKLVCSVSTPLLESFLRGQVAAASGEEARTCSRCSNRVADAHKIRRSQGRRARSKWDYTVGHEDGSHVRGWKTAPPKEVQRLHSSPGDVMQTSDPVCNKGTNESNVILQVGLEFNVGAFIITIGFWSPLYYKY